MKNDKKTRFAARRRGVVKAAVKAHTVDVVLITNVTDMYYLTGCPEGAQGVLCGPGWTILFTGKMHEHVIPGQAPGVDVRIIAGPLGKAIASALREKKHRKALGFQGNQMTWTRYNALSEAMGRRRLISIADTVIDYRAVKDNREVTLTRKCVRIAEAAFLELTGRGAGYLVGKTEKALAAELEYLMRQHGADRQAFPATGIIVASGPNSASCHHHPSNRKVKRNDVLLIDWGAELDGYRSDITRTLFMGRVPGRFAELYDLVLQAHDAGVAAMRPGVRCNTVAKKGWDVIRDAGYGDTVRHGLGHGLGMDIHERPGFGNGISPRNGSSPPLRKGMILTIEPGIYFKGEGGIRIEDDILVTAKGAKTLNRLSRQLKDMVLT